MSKSKIFVSIFLAVAATGYLICTVLEDLNKKSNDPHTKNR
jgi:hypothetical protein